MLEKNLQLILNKIIRLVNVFLLNFFYYLGMFNSLWYKSLIKPILAPPDWVFAPAWGILYLMILSSFFVFLISKHENKKFGYLYFFIQLFLNIIWTPIFFSLQNIGLAFLVILLLDIFVFFTIYEFLKISKLAGLLLVPYLLWILYATYLNGGYLFLN